MINRRVLRPWFLLMILVCPGLALATEVGERLRLWPDNLFGVVFPTPEVGFISGYAGTFLRTDDGGKTWAWSNVGVNELLRRIAFVDDRRGWAVGHRGSILHTADGGATWDVQAQRQGTYLRDVTFADADHGWVVGHDATILATEDGGGSWQPQKLTGFKGRDLPRLHAASAIDASRAMLVGEFGVAAYTADGGTTWQVFDTGTKKTLLALAHLGRGTFLTAGLDGTLMRLEPAIESSGVSPDSAGQDTARDLVSPTPYTSRAIDADTTEHFFAVSAVNDGRAIAAGRAVLRLVDGDAVTSVDVDESIQLPFSWFGGADVASSGQLWLVGIRGTIASGNVTEQESGLVSIRAALGRSDSIKVARQNGDIAGTRP